MSDTIEQRLERLERGARRWRAIALAAVGVLAVVTFGGAAEPKGDAGGVVDVLRVRGLFVVDNDDHAIVSMSAGQDGGGGIVVQNPKDKGSITMLSNPGRSSIGIANVAGKSVVKFNAAADSGIVSVNHAGGTAAFQVAPTETGGVFVRSVDAEGKTIWSAPTGGNVAR